MVICSMRREGTHPKYMLDHCFDTLFPGKGIDEWLSGSEMAEMVGEMVEMIEKGGYPLKYPSEISLAEAVERMIGNWLRLRAKRVKTEAEVTEEC